MGRWGGEETKSQGILGCAFAGILLVVVAWGAYKAYPAVSHRSAFEKKINKIIRGARKKKVVAIENEIMECAKNNHLDILREDIEVIKRKKDKYTPVVEVHVQIHVEVDFGWGPTEITLPPVVAEVTLIQF